MTEQNYWIVPTESDRLNERHEVLGPYSTSGLADHVRDQYRNEGIPCETRLSVTRPEARVSAPMIEQTFHLNDRVALGADEANWRVVALGGRGNTGRIGLTARATPGNAIEKWADAGELRLFGRPSGPVNREHERVEVMADDTAVLIDTKGKQDPVMYPEISGAGVPYFEDSTNLLPLASDEGRANAEAVAAESATPKPGGWMADKGDGKPGYPALDWKTMPGLEPPASVTSFRTAKGAVTVRVGGGWWQPNDGDGELPASDSSVEGWDIVSLVADDYPLTDTTMPGQYSVPADDDWRRTPVGKLAGSTQPPPEGELVATAEVIEEGDPGFVTEVPWLGIRTYSDLFPISRVTTDSDGTRHYRWSDPVTELSLSYTEKNSTTRIRGRRWESANGYGIELVRSDDPAADPVVVANSIKQRATAGVNTSPLLADLPPGWKITAPLTHPNRPTLEEHVIAASLGGTLGPVDRAAEPDSPMAGIAIRLCRNQLAAAMGMDLTAEQIPDFGHLVKEVREVYQGDDQEETIKEDERALAKTARRYRRERDEAREQLATKSDTEGQEFIDRWAKTETDPPVPCSSCGGWLGVHAMSCQPADSPVLLPTEDLVTAERQRQVTKLGHTPEHDEQHTHGELLRAAASMLFADGGLWPWDKVPEFDHLRLVKATALLEAELDRQHRVNVTNYRAEMAKQHEDAQAAYKRLLGTGQDLTTGSTEPATAVGDVISVTVPPEPEPGSVVVALDTGRAWQRAPRNPFVASDNQVTWLPVGADDYTGMSVSPLSWPMLLATSPNGVRWVHNPVPVEEDPAELVKDIPRPTETEGN